MPTSRVLAVALALPVLFAAARAQAATTIGSGQYGVAASASASCDLTSVVHDDNTLPPATSGPFTASDAAAPPDADLSCADGAGHGEAGGTMDAAATIDPATGGLTVTATSHLHGGATATHTGSPEAEGGVGHGEANSRVEVTFTIDHETTYAFSDSGTATIGAGTTADTFGQLRPAGGGTTIFLSTSGGGPSTPANGTLPPGTYVYQSLERLFANADKSNQGSHAATIDYSSVFTLGGACATGQTDLAIGLAVAHGCFIERKDSGGQGTGVYETDKEAWVGGFDLRPQPGGKLVVEPANHDAPLRAEGSVDLAFDDILIPAPLDEIHPFVASYALGINTAGSVERFVALPLLKSASTQVTVTWAAGGTGATLDGSVSVDELSKSVGTVAGASVGTLSGKLTLTLANNAPADLTKGELQLPEVTLEVKDTKPPLKEGFGGATFKAQKVNGVVEWSGEVSTFFPFQDRQGSLTGRLFLRDSSLSGLGFALSGLKVPIGKTGWDLTGVNGNLVLGPTLGFDVGVEAAQPLGRTNTTLFKLTGNVKGLALATDCSNGANPFEFVGTTNAPELEERKIGQLKAQVLMCAYVRDPRSFAFEAALSGELTVDVGPAEKVVSAKGSASGWFHGTDFNLEGHYELKLPVIGTIAADGLLSSEGYAICGTYGFISAGIATHNWLDAPEDVVGCDFGPYRAAHAAAHAAATTRAVHVAAGQRAVALAVRGAKGVAIRGPHGERLRAAGALKTRATIVVPSSRLHTTYVFLRRPRAGTWRIRALRGAITRIDTATQLPRARVKGTLVRRGKRRVLTWSARAIRGQRIEIVDRTATGVVTLQRYSSRHKGRLRFTPSAIAARHTVEALVLQDGVPRERLTILRFRAGR
jgi:hypothetical protein